MVEKHPVLDFFSHTLLALGVVVIVFPIYLALVGSTHSAQDMAQSPIPIWFGQDAWYNYRTILLGEGPGVTSQVPVARMMWVSLVTALTIAFGKIVISLLSAFAIVYFNFPFRKAVFWGIFITLMLPVEVRIVPTLPSGRRLWHGKQFCGLDYPAHCLGYGHVFVPAIFPDGAR
jgi:sn-glycerol 3-phosphate transport system permease protein